DRAGDLLGAGRLPGRARVRDEPRRRHRQLPRPRRGVRGLPRHRRGAAPLREGEAPLAARCLPLLGRVERLVQGPLGARRLAGRAAAERGGLQPRGRPRRRAVAQRLPAPLRRAEDRLPGAGGEHDLAPDRARRPAPAPHDLLPDPAGGAARDGPIARAADHRAGRRDAAVRVGTTPRRGRELRRREGPGGGLPGQPQPAGGDHHRDRLARRRARAGHGDPPDRGHRPQGGQHLRAAGSHRAPGARRAARARRDTHPDPTTAVVHRDRHGRLRRHAGL
ncbi:MAG: GH51, partial [uncultured Thermomicrobiales bacterium]